MRAADRYADFTEAELDSGLQWLSTRGEVPWAKRLRIDGDNIFGDLRGVPPVIRQLLRDHLAAIALMSPAQRQTFWAHDMAARSKLVDQMLTKAGR